jgi:integrase
LLAGLEKIGDFVFPGVEDGKPLSNMAMLVLLQKRMGRADLTVHGFRSTFREWSAEVSNYPHELAEAALAHTIEDPTEAAYRRGDMLAKRAKMMESWSMYCSQTSTGKVIPMAENRVAR